ncbi:long-chain fatty acid--CoA ligase [Streptomyces sp. WMMB 322]|uniref:acyl-CoA synthetase n=1 Tax=Streptomyces sp. WMMB 322 TaxID=1286821 RepID=UPI0006E3E638|nr:long-chain fatty acid--CoA ligase [Streptomyces sp. WMMB 322]SCK25332.1 fatty-acyl-CoA synthase [Streptomyces sp. WMMB 322]
MHNQGIGSWPGRRAQLSPGRTAFVHDGEAVTYAGVHRRSTRLASQLRAEGVGPGDRVAYLGPNHPAFAETMFATHMLGGVFVPLNFRLTAPELDYVLGHSGASLLVYGPECARTAADLTARGGLRGVVALRDPSPGERDYEPWLAAGDPSPLDATVSRDDPAFILYTSGTTGRPKGAVLTHANVIWNTLNLMVGLDIASDEVTLISAPLFHVAALNQTLLPTFLKGGCSVIMPSWDVDACYDLIAEHRITWMFGVTTMFAAFAQSPRWPGADLSSLRHLISGGAPVPEALIRTYQERGLVFCQGYGLTETSPGATWLEAAESVERAGSAGVPVFFADVRLVRPDLTETEPGERGEVLIQGPNVTPGYWNDPGATAAAFSEGGWFHSGDVATRDEDGFITIVDRVKDMYISGGENVYPAEIEAVLFEHPSIAACAVIGVPDEKWGQTGRAFFTPRPGTRATAEELRSFLSARLAKYKIPAYFEEVDSLPRTGSGKIQKQKLRELPLPPGG